MRWRCGAGRVAALKLAAEGGAELWLVNRTKAKAEAVAAEIRQRYPGASVNVGYPKAGMDLVLNATSLGLNSDDASPLDGKAFSLREARAVYDELAARSRHEHVSPAWLAISAGSAGLLDEAIGWTEAAVQRRDPLVLWGRHMQFWDPVRMHPRFLEIMQGVWE